MWRGLVFFSVVACVEDPTLTTPAGPDLSTVPDGEYYVGFSIAAVGGLVVPLQLDVTPAADGDGIVFAQVDLRAVGEDETVSEVLVSLTDVPVSPETGFVIELPAFELPGAYSPTGSDVSIQATLTAASVTADAFCGDVTGEIITFGIDLVGSTFGATRWENRAEAPFSCAPPVTEEIPRITDCPALVEGVNTAFPSGGRSRSFQVVLPTGYDAAQDWPLVLVYHGFGGNSADMLDGAELRPYADARGVILVVPDGEDLGGTPGWDTFSDPLTNVDLALFDDLVTCASESYSVDPDRIHVTGMSNGGLMTGYLIATRADVIASAAPMSGGVGTDVLPSDHDVPSLVIWGGEIDTAFEQDFNQLSLDMIDLFLADGQFVIGCDHGLGHELDPSFWPWVFDFLLAHPYTLASKPYEAGLLPESFPDYCAIR
jgi:predicted esterase